MILLFLISVLIDTIIVDNPVFLKNADLKSALFTIKNIRLATSKEMVSRSIPISSPWSNVMTDTTISNNIVSNMGKTAFIFLVQVLDFVALSLGNVLNDNPVGANFESGLKLI